MPQGRTYHEGSQLRPDELLVAEIERLRAILYNAALAMGAEDSPSFHQHIGLVEQSASEQP
jgi:hypothetical protein